MLAGLAMAGPAVWGEEEAAPAMAGPAVWATAKIVGVAVWLHRTDHHCGCGRAGPRQASEPPACAIQQGMDSGIN